ncbi:hypothetical protein CONPUDRAFT_156476 [Coniophora puteana RWD-64-598 SS2]|uniref:Uncharacterized protein n=1 Tax=Coniophora puteana (strain RWD-64-598) TaxID=741705 RepID=A0A5M3MHB0_CONPW|nr:uncharacterized protein CONPUDRAFT_156476 [Coniophora puteana RWD-64-598 SS2]EIW78493.1 hypothetical protein CONPUDRAFT_156476 [Coniophora puteana RWD-64-598 SS2]
MSSNTNTFAPTSQGGTNSPPLEASGQHRTMGVSSIDGSVSKPAMDIDQRAAYFHESDKQQSGTMVDEEPTRPEKIKTD